jgi:hypothetical protein
MRHHGHRLGRLRVTQAAARVPAWQLRGHVMKKQLSFNFKSAMPSKRSASVSLDASPTKTKVSRVNAAAEDLARAAGSGKADPSCTIPGTLYIYPIIFRSHHDGRINGHKKIDCLAHSPRLWRWIRSHALQVRLCAKGLMDRGLMPCLIRCQILLFFRRHVQY